MKKILSILTLSCVLMLSSCEEWLDKYPLSKMSPETFFSNENELQAFSNKFYTAFPDDELYNEYWDNLVHSDLPQEMRGGRTIPASGGGWTWTDLRDINTLLEYSVNCKDTGVRTHYDAVARFFRAYFYFEKVKRFGDVPWYAKPIGSDDPELKRPRDSREFVMQRMIEDIDFAIRHLPTEHDLYRVTKWTALALKSRFCLFEGTFRKYHGIDGHEHDWKWYLQQAADAAGEFITHSGYGLYTEGGTRTAYRDLFVSEEAQGIEIVLARDYSKSLGVFHNSTFYSQNTSYGRPGITRKIVDSYLMGDGSRFTDRPDWQTMEFKDQCADRDPRLGQSIRTPGYTRIGSTKTEVPSLSTCMTGYQPIKFVAPIHFESDGYNLSYTDLPIFRTAEIYLNYAEAKAEAGTLTQEDIDRSVKKLRDRAGMPNLDMAKANANPDPYLSDAKTGYPNVRGDNRGVILEIRRERTIELLQEGHRYYDIIRWKEGKSFEQPLLGLYIPSKGEYDIDGDGTPDVYFASRGESHSTKAPLVLELDQDIFLSEGDHGYIMPHKNNPGEWNEERDYLYPIPTNDRSLTGGALTQNPGWNDGLDL
ncbi:RagB/SusD family nutrient uptake outer membrane protein [Alistipes sp.]|uniref:RagB/SusD family nutrient uptake outer membrane protein n=1 Tax=Alistipes sp. TaxID=1872444 RepID=UPI0025B8FC2E|nr:RagB/SusD family nutrient uptake outer membrane protein [Alistipes sp.]